MAQLIRPQIDCSPEFARFFYSFFAATAMFDNYCFCVLCALLFHFGSEDESKKMIEDARCSWCLIEDLSGLAMPIELNRRNQQTNCDSLGSKQTEIMFEPIKAD